MAPYNNGMNNLANDMSRLSIGATRNDTQRHIHLAFFLHRVSENMSLAALKNEYSFRHGGDMHGTCNKTKAWFLKELGLNSICESAYAAGIAPNLPRVGDRSMTVPMLKKELRARQPGIVTSGFDKQWLIDQLGFGSVMMTQQGVTQHIWAATQPGPPPVV